MSSIEFFPGQRWIIDSDPEIGLGMVVGSESRRVRIFFPQSGEERTYATDNAPLSRVVFAEGDQLTSADGWQGKVKKTDESQALINYLAYNEDTDETRTIPETQILNGTNQFQALDRLIRGRWDRAGWYRMRRTLRNTLPDVIKSEVRGLVGPRITPVPHQLYIASELSQRQAPRVLLADEVGLGKTIEAGLIMHQQLLSGAASRILVLVPDSLVHQWLVEMLRRFNLKFSVIDEEWISTPNSNCFDEAQLFICPQSLMWSDIDHLQKALMVDWDLLVVDEAHHVDWSTDDVSWEYSCLEQLAIGASGLLLLTATPEQLGNEGHFGRLRLLDSARYSDFYSWEKEEREFGRLNTLLASIEAGEQIDLTLYSDILSEEESALLTKAKTPAALESVYDLLLDRHGTGRVMFRNTRKVVADLIPGRELQAYPLDGSHSYGSVLASRRGVTPEVGLDDSWVDTDPRAHWLVDFLKQNKDRKILVIAAHADTVQTLESWLTLRNGIRAASFHEGMSLVNRDRAAAWFADEEDGAQVLLCSEIGSEGRNFQFSSDLVMFDLPAHPDLLEQRIGRLDRIGQRNRVTVHVPYLDNSAQALLVRLFDDGFDAFVGASAANGIVYSQYEGQIGMMLEEPNDDWDTVFSAIQLDVEAQRTALASGRDRLLERASHRPERANDILNELLNQDCEPLLEQWFLDSMERFGVDSELLSDAVYLLKPSGHKMVEQLPQLAPEGISITFDRDKASAREDIEWLTWEHPLVMAFIELLSSGDYGTSNAAVMKMPDVAPGTIVMECYFRPLSIAPKRLKLHRFAPTQPLRVVMSNGKIWDDAPTTEWFDECRIKIERKKLIGVVQKLGDTLKKIVRSAAEYAHADINAECVDAVYDAEDHYDAEIERLESLRMRNPSIRQDEIDRLMVEKEEVMDALRKIEGQLDGVRLLIAT